MEDDSRHSDGILLDDEDLMESEILIDKVDPCDEWNPSLFRSIKYHKVHTILNLTLTAILICSIINVWQHWDPGSGLRSLDVEKYHYYCLFPFLLILLEGF